LNEFAVSPKRVAGYGASAVRAKAERGSHESRIDTTYCLRPTAYLITGTWFAFLPQRNVRDRADRYNWLQTGQVSP